jgi:hypothetical protein
MNLPVHMISSRIKPRRNTVGSREFEFVVELKKLAARSRQLCSKLAAKVCCWQKHQNRQNREP